MRLLDVLLVAIGTISMAMPPRFHAITPTHGGHDLAARETIEHNHSAGHHGSGHHRSDSSDPQPVEDLAAQQCMIACMALEPRPILAAQIIEHPIAQIVPPSAHWRDGLSSPCPERPPRALS